MMPGVNIWWRFIAFGIYIALSWAWTRYSRVQPHGRAATAVVTIALIGGLLLALRLL